MDAGDAGTRGRGDAFLKKSLAKNFLEMIRVVCIWYIWINKLMVAFLSSLPLREGGPRQWWMSVADGVGVPSAIV